VASAGLGAMARSLGKGAVAAADRGDLRIPVPADPAPPLVDGVDLGVAGGSPFLTPVDRFYRVDTALVVPKVGLEEWRLRIGGLVERPITLTFADLIARPLIERDITLNCVSNDVGGRYIGTTRWIGAPLAPLLQEAGIRPEATQIAGRSIDGFTAATPLASAIDGRDAMLAVAMGGEPLTFEHGFPVRMLVPGLYGYESATKWITRIDLVGDDFQAYWVKRGWARAVDVKTASRIDTPRRGDAVPAGLVDVAGVAWAQRRGIAAVEVRIDDGPWIAAELGAEQTIDTWRQWRYRWSAAPGEHVVEVRATDGTGVVQDEAERPPFPSGATGYHAVRVTVA
jgi:DMSO/TMAO reductase YedYZ molybdopterin-dependent catalytic subunit